MPFYPAQYFAVKQYSTLFYWFSKVLETKPTHCICEAGPSALSHTPSPIFSDSHGCCEEMLIKVEQVHFLNLGMQRRNHKV